MRLSFFIMVLIAGVVGMVASPIPTAGHAVGHLSDGPYLQSRSLPDIIKPRAAKTFRRTAEVYSFCGACTEESECGTGNDCCFGDCSDGLMKCYQTACPPGG